MSRKRALPASHAHNPASSEPSPYHTTPLHRPCPAGSPACTPRTPTCSTRRCTWPCTCGACTLQRCGGLSGSNKPLLQHSRTLDAGLALIFAVGTLHLTWNAKSSINPPCLPALLPQWPVKRTAASFPRLDCLNRTALHWVALLGEHKLLRWLLESGQYRCRLPAVCAMCAALRCKLERLAVLSERRHNLHDGLQQPAHWRHQCFQPAAGCGARVRSGR